MTIDERLEALTMNLELMSHSHEALAQRHEALAQKQAEDYAKSERYHAKTENLLRRAIEAGVQEARNQRKRSLALDEKIAHLAKSQEVTQKLFQAWLKRGENGKH